MLNQWLLLCQYQYVSQISVLYYHMEALLQLCNYSNWSGSLYFFFLIAGFLPSSFSMYAVTLSSALFLLENYAAAVSVAAAGVILGWPFSILVFLPVTVYSLIRGSFRRVFLSGFLTSMFLLVSCTCILSLFLQWSPNLIWLWKLHARSFRLLLITTAMANGQHQCSIFWNIMCLVVVKVTCMEQRGLHSILRMDSITSILRSSWLCYFWGLCHLQGRNMSQIYW